MDSVPTTANVEYHARIVRDKSIHRRLIQVGAEIARLGYSEDREIEDVMDQAERAVFEITQRGSQVPFRKVGDVLGPTFDHRGEIPLARQLSVTGVPSGFDDFERITGGSSREPQHNSRQALHERKTACPRHRHARLGGQGIPVLIFSLEMGAEQLVQRMLGSRARVDVHDLRTGMFHESAWEKLAAAAGDLSRAPFFIDDSSVLTTLELRARSRRFKSQVMRSGSGLIVVDYLQLMQLTRKTESKQQEVAEISRSLKAIARELDVPLIAISQLSRAVESRQEKRPQLSDLRDSGAIEAGCRPGHPPLPPGYYDAPAEGRQHRCDRGEAQERPHRHRKAHLFQGTRPFCEPGLVVMNGVGMPIRGRPYRSSAPSRGEAIDRRSR